MTETTFKEASIGGLILIIVLTSVGTVVLRETTESPDYRQCRSGMMYGTWVPFDKPIEISEFAPALGKYQCDLTKEELWCRDATKTRCYFMEVLSKVRDEVVLKTSEETIIPGRFSIKSNVDTKFYDSDSAIKYDINLTNVPAVDGLKTVRIEFESPIRMLHPYSFSDGERTYFFDRIKESKKIKEPFYNEESGNWEDEEEKDLFWIHKVDDHIIDLVYDESVMFHDPRIYSSEASDFEGKFFFGSVLDMLINMSSWESGTFTDGVEVWDSGTNTNFFDFCNGDYAEDNNWGALTCYGTNRNIYGLIVDTITGEVLDYLLLVSEPGNVNQNKPRSDVMILNGTNEAWFIYEGTSTENNDIYFRNFTFIRDSTYSNYWGTAQTFDYGTPSGYDVGVVFLPIIKQRPGYREAAIFFQQNEGWASPQVLIFALMNETGLIDVVSPIMNKSSDSSFPSFDVEWTNSSTAFLVAHNQTNPATAVNLSFFIYNAVTETMSTEYKVDTPYTNSRGREVDLCAIPGRPDSMGLVARGYNGDSPSHAVILLANGTVEPGFPDEKFRSYSYPHCFAEPSGDQVIFFIMGQNDGCYDAAIYYPENKSWVDSDLDSTADCTDYTNDRVLRGATITNCPNGNDCALLSVMTEANLIYSGEYWNGSQMVVSSTALIENASNSDNFPFWFLFESGQRPPTTPTDVQCDGNGCNETFTSSIELNCSGSTDNEGDIITYIIEVGNYSSSMAFTTNALDDTETFAADLGDWLNADWDTHDWQRDSGGTPSGGTGPGSGSSSCGTCDQGGDGWYVFVETSSGSCDNVGESAVLYLSPEINFSDYDSVNVSVWLNMYGFDGEMGTVRVQENTTGSWADFYNITGNQGTDWFYVNANVSGKTGIGKVAITLSCLADYRGDAALDTITVTGEYYGEVFDYTYTEVGNHTEGESYSWDISGENAGEVYEHLRCRAIDTNGSDSYSDYYIEQVELTIGSGEVNTTVGIIPAPSNNTNTLLATFTLNGTLDNGDGETARITFYNCTDSGGWTCELLCDNESIADDATAYCEVTLGNGDSMWWMVNATDVGGHASAEYGYFNVSYYVAPGTPDFNLSFGPDGTTVFRIGGCGPSKTNYSAYPQGQDDTYGIDIICNNGTATGDLNMNLSGTPNTGWYLYASNTSSFTGQVNLTEDPGVMKRIYGGLTQGSCIYIWFNATCLQVTENPGVYEIYQIS